MSIAHRTTHCFAFCFLLAGIMCLFPDVSFASGVSEFETPFNAVMNTITGPVGKSISIVLLAAAGIVYWWRREDLEGGFKIFLQSVMAISFISFSSSIVGSLFTFSSGAMI